MTRLVWRKKVAAAEALAQSKAQSQRRWLQTPENQNYFRGPENRQRVKDWRKANPGYWRKKKSSTQVPLQDFFLSSKRK